MLIESVSELPNLEGAKDVYLDFETSSRNPKLNSLNPWHNCYVAGFAITVDDHPNAYYIQYQDFRDEDKQEIRDWLNNILLACDNWINQNVKYDAHVAANDLGIEAKCWLVCTLTLAKILDSDKIMRGGYGLDALSRDWLGEDISDFERDLKPYLKNNKDYGKIPADIIGKYGCQDVITNRKLYAYECATVPDDCLDVWYTEIELTGNLWQMERNGMYAKLLDIKVEQYTVLNRILTIDAELAELCNRSFNPASPDQCFEVLCNQFGLPILAYTKNDETGEDTNNPSFAKAVLEMYAVHPLAPFQYYDEAAKQTKSKLIALIQEYRELWQMNNLFLSPWQEFLIDDLLHSTYNQCVRTGRMSCSEPNAQQLSSRVKKLIRPRPGYVFISIDASQVEFRFIVHYIQDLAALKAYRENPNTDFHKWVAGMCGIKRKPAKTVNFAVAFGEGKKKLIKQLKSNADLVGTIKDQVKELIATGQVRAEDEVNIFNILAERKAVEVYNTYHNTLPTLKRTMKDCENSLKRYGYVFNIRGRRRHLPVNKAFRAFNTINQSSAADLMKERFNALCRYLVENGIDAFPVANVHDAVLLEVREDLATPQLARAIVNLLEHPPYEDKIDVPIVWTVGTSRNNWNEADNADLERNKALDEWVHSLEEIPPVGLI